MSISKDLKAEIEAAAKKLKIAPSTVGERAGQGGQFYKRLEAGKRVWPETAEAVRKSIHEMLSPSDSLPDGSASPEEVGITERDFKTEGAEGV